MNPNNQPNQQIPSNQNQSQPNNSPPPPPSWQQPPTNSNSPMGFNSNAMPPIGNKGNKQNPLIIISIAVVILLILAGVYFFFFTNRVPSDPRELFDYAVDRTSSDFTEHVQYIQNIGDNMKNYTLDASLIFEDNSENQERIEAFSELCGLTGEVNDISLSLNISRNLDNEKAIIQATSGGQGLFYMVLWLENSDESDYPNIYFNLDKDKNKCIDDALSPDVKQEIKGLILDLLDDVLEDSVIDELSGMSPDKMLYSTYKIEGMEIEKPLDSIVNLFNDISEATGNNLPMTDESSNYQEYIDKHAVNDMKTVVDSISENVLTIDKNKRIFNFKEMLEDNYDFRGYTVNVYQLETNPDNVEKMAGQLYDDLKIFENELLGEENPSRDSFIEAMKGFLNDESLNLDMMAVFIDVKTGELRNIRLLSGYYDFKDLDKEDYLDQTDYLDIVFEKSKDGVWKIIFNLVEDDESTEMIFEFKFSKDRIYFKFQFVDPKDLSFTFSFDMKAQEVDIDIPSNVVNLDFTDEFIDNLVDQFTGGDVSDDFIVDDYNDYNYNEDDILPDYDYDDYDYDDYDYDRDLYEDALELTGLMNSWAATNGLDNVNTVFARNLANHLDDQVDPLSDLITGRNIDGTFNVQIHDPSGSFENGGWTIYITDGRPLTTSTILDSISTNYFPLNALWGIVGYECQQSAGIYSLIKTGNDEIAWVYDVGLIDYRMKCI